MIKIWSKYKDLLLNSIYSIYIFFLFFYCVKWGSSQPDGVATSSYSLIVYSYVSRCVEQFIINEMI